MRALIVGLALVPLWAGAEAAPVRAAAKPAPVAAPSPAPIVEKPSRTEAAPWWMDAPVLPQTGDATLEAEANRASFAVSFEVSDKTVEKALAKVNDQTAPLTEALRKLDPAAVKVSTAFEMRALYKQYRLKDGTKVEDERGDRIEAYQVTTTLNVEVRDLSILERAFALTQAASPTTSEPISFNLEADNDLKSRLFTAAISDARARAEASALIMGRTLGGIRVIDPTGRVCATDILGRKAAEQGSEDGLPKLQYESLPAQAMRKREIVVSGTRAEALEAKAAQNAFLQSPPLYSLSAKACLIYELK